MRLLAVAAAWFGISIAGCSSKGSHPIGPTAETGSSTTPVPMPFYGGAGLSAEAQPLTDATVECFYGAASGKKPAATIEYKLEAIQEVDTIHVRLTFDPAFVDNTYGTGSVGWGQKGHNYRDLVGSDHSELVLSDAQGNTTFDFKLDYISTNSVAQSGYQNLGVAGGDGRWILGDKTGIVATMTSLDRNLNERGYKQYILNSPATDATYTPNPATPNWDYRVVYEAWVRTSAFGTSGFGKAQLNYVHASPSKWSSNQENVMPGPCPPDWGTCDRPDGCPGGSGSDVDAGGPGACANIDGCPDGSASPSADAAPPACACTTPGGCPGYGAGTHSVLEGGTCQSSADCTSGDVCDNCFCQPSTPIL